MFLADPEGPFTVSAERFQIREHKLRALAEIDGMVAGFKYLDKAEKPDCVELPEHTLQDIDDQVLCDLGREYIGWDVTSW